jgi:hypothetical protein
MKFRRKHEEIDAMQWDGTNTKELERWAGVNLREGEDSGCRYLALPPMSLSPYGSIGWYLVKGPEQDPIRFWRPEELERQFEPIPDELPQVGELMGHNPGTGVPDVEFVLSCVECKKPVLAFNGTINGKHHCYACFIKDIPVPTGNTVPLCK